MLFEHHDELERIDGIETDAGGAEKGCLIADVGGFEIEHELGDEEFFEALACEHVTIGKGSAEWVQIIPPSMGRAVPVI
jgi:hypothetical protein